MKKVILALCCFALLTACAAKVKENNTISNITESTTAETMTETPSAKPVAGLDSLSASKVVWGCGNIENHAQPAEPLMLEGKYRQLGAQWFCKDEKSVCLTFDEGYENGFTPSILDTLKEKSVKAVFFVTYDFAKDNPQLIKRIIDDGHILANHSYHHYSMDELDTDTAKEEVAFLHNYIQNKYNYTMSYFRFPKGEFSERTLAILKSLNYKSVFWSFAYADWDTENQPDESTALKKICESVHPGEIMLLHAVSKTNASILGKVIDDVRAQGYEFTTEL